MNPKPDVHSPHIVCIVEGFIPTVDIAIIQPFDWLRDHDLITYEVLVVQDVTKKTISTADIIIFVRGADPLNLYWLYTAQCLGKRIIYLLDDNFFGLPKNTPIGRHYSRPAIVQTITCLLEVADLSIVGSPMLLESMPIPRSRSLCIPFVYPHFVEPIRPSLSNNEIILGFFGTAGHRDDFLSIMPALQEILAKNPETRLEICGFTSLPGLDDLSDRISYIPYDDNYRRFMRSISYKGWHIGLAPLSDSPSNRCKTDVKYRDYSAYGLPAVYSRVEPYVSRIKDGVNGLLADTNEDWTRALTALIKSPNLRLKIGQNALRDVRLNNSVERVASIWQKDVFAHIMKLPINSSNRKYYSILWSIEIHIRILYLKIKARLRKFMPAPVLRFYRRIRWRHY